MCLVDSSFHSRSNMDVLIFNPAEGPGSYWRISVWGDEMTNSSLWEKHPQSHQGRALLPGFSLSYSTRQLRARNQPSHPLQSSTRGSQELFGVHPCECWTSWFCGYEHGERNPWIRQLHLLFLMVTSSHLLFLSYDKGQS